MALRFLILAFGPLLLLSCRTITPPGELNEQYRDIFEQRRLEYRLKMSDSVQVTFFNEDVPDLNQQFTILPDGRSDPFFMDGAVLAGMTARQLEEAIRRFYTNEVTNPEISVSITPAPEFIFLEGEVGRMGGGGGGGGGGARRGRTEYYPEMTLQQLMASSGGYRDEASADEIVLRRPIRDPRFPDVHYLSLYDHTEEVFLLPNDEIYLERTIPIFLRDYLRIYFYGLLPPIFNSLLSGAI